jgi:hypothetical protein
MASYGHTKQNYPLDHGKSSVAETNECTFSLDTILQIVRDWKYPLISPMNRQNTILK